MLHLKTRKDTQAPLQDKYIFKKIVVWLGLYVGFSYLKTRKDIRVPFQNKTILFFYGSINVNVWRSIIGFLHWRSKDRSIITDKPSWSIGMFNKSSIVSSIKFSCMVHCGSRAKLFKKTNLINNKWHKKSFCAMDLCDVSNTGKLRQGKEMFTQQDVCQIINILKIIINQLQLILAVKKIRYWSKSYSTNSVLCNIRYWFLSMYNFRKDKRNSSIILQSNSKNFVNI